MRGRRGESNPRNSHCSAIGSEIFPNRGAAVLEMRSGEEHLNSPRSRIIGEQDGLDPGQRAHVGDLTGLGGANLVGHQGDNGIRGGAIRHIKATSAGVRA